MAGAFIVAERMGLVRDGLVALLGASRPAGAVRGVGSLAEALRLLEAEPEALLLLDLALLPQGAAGLQGVRVAAPGVRIVALAADDARESILQALAAGAHGYVAKSAAAAELMRAVEAVEAGGVHVPAALAAAPRELPPGSAAPVATPQGMRAGAGGAGPVGVCHLTGRQRDVLLLLAEGRSTKDIARTMDLAVSTIKVHLAALYRSVGARNRVEALCRAGLVPREPLMN